MALGATIGDVHMRTVNNGAAAVPYRDTMDYFPTGKYLWRNPVWVNLLGDPTTRPFMLTPATDVRATETQDGVALSWSTRAGPDVLGYRVYRATQGSADFVRISGDDIVKGSDFIDPDPQGNALYMIRAYGLKRVYAGSFYTLSQGAFTVVGVTPVTAGDIRITTQMDQPVALPDAFNAPEDQTIHAIITGPNRGKLHHDGTGWQYTPPAGFRGEASIRFSLSDALGTDEGLLTIGIGE
jgi:hypothetical protein